MALNFRRDADTIIDLNADTLDNRDLPEILKKTVFTYKDTSKILTVVGSPFVVDIIDSVTHEKIYADIEIVNNQVTIRTSEIPTNELNITVMSTLL